MPFHTLSLPALAIAPGDIPRERIVPTYPSDQVKTPPWAGVILSPLLYNWVDAMKLQDTTLGSVVLHLMRPEELG